MLKDGVKVAWPDGTTVWSARYSSGSESPAKTIDGDTGTKYYSGSWDSTRPEDALYFTLPESVTFDSFRYATAGDADFRDPISFRLEVGVPAGGTTNWTTVSEQQDVTITRSRGAYTQSFAAGIPDTDAVSELLRFWVLKTRGSGGIACTSGYCQYSEFELLKDGVKVAWPDGTTVWSGKRDPFGGEGPAKVIDGDTGTKFYTSTWDSAKPEDALHITLPAPVTFDSFRYATANDADSRDPISFRLEKGVVAGGTTNWAVISRQEDVTITRGRKTLTQPFAVYSVRESGVSVSAGARLVVRSVPDAARSAGVDADEQEVTLQDLSGNGLVIAESASRIRVTGSSTFSGLLQTAEDVSLIASSAVLPPLGCAEETMIVRNDGAEGSLNATAGLTRQFGAYRDGSAPLGISVSNGAELRFVAAPSNAAPRAAYTGATTVDAGSTLSITGPDVLSARHFRFTPIISRCRDSSADKTNKCCKIGDIRLMRDGAELPWPLGTAASSDNCLADSPAVNVLDGSARTVCKWKIDEEPFGFAPIVIAAPTAVRFDGYCWYTGPDDADWDPKNWTFEYSQDGEAWIPLDAKTRSFKGDRARSSLGYCYRMDVGNVGRQTTVRARYLRFMPWSNRGADQLQLSEIRLRKDGAEVPWPEGTTAESRFATGSEGAEKLVDNDVETKCYWSAPNSIAPVLITMPTTVAFSGYGWYTANDVPDRDPTDWTFEYSLDGETWVMMDAQRGFLATSARKASAYSFDCGGPDLPPVASDALSDDSPVALAGTLSVACANETIGALSGDGRVSLAGRDCVLGVKTATSAAFSGTLTGDGTFVKRGAGVQTLSGDVPLVGTLVVEEGTLDLADVSLPGVTNVILRGGRLIGKASVGGDLSISCEDGICAAKLTVAGTLTLAGRFAAQLAGGTPCDLSAGTLAIAPGTKVVIDATAVVPTALETMIRLCSATAVVGALDPANVSFRTTKENERFFAGATVVTQLGTEFGLWVRRLKRGLCILFR